MGFACGLRPVDALVYRARFENCLVQHEFVHIHAGTFGGPVAPDRAEVAAWRWIDVPALLEWMANEPSAFTVWFRCMIERTGLSALLRWADG